MDAEIGSVDAWAFQLCFGAKARHQPVGAIVPDTILQAFGATQLTHLSHCCPSFGVV